MYDVLTVAISLVTQMCRKLFCLLFEDKTSLDSERPRRNEKQDATSKCDIKHGINAGINSMSKFYAVPTCSGMHTWKAKP